MRLPTLFAAYILPLTTVLSAPNRLPQPIISSRSKVPEKQEQPPDTKYFHEPGTNSEMGHYDIRYYKAPVDYDQRGETLKQLIQSYLTIFRDHNVETWIAHGTLLGWWWNGKIMPWDWDLDTQVSATTLAWLGDNLNMTIHDYAFIEKGENVTRQFLLDINPNHKERVRGDGQNVIDARWIDMTNGLFIDITGLAEVYPDAQPGIWSCKNWHRYRTRDIYPLRESVFEGVPALVPFAFDKILTEEYSNKALTKTFHEGHRWIPERKEWVKQEPIDSTPAKVARQVPHIPRSLLGEENRKPGLRNFFRAF